MNSSHDTRDERHTAGEGAGGQRAGEREKKEGARVAEVGSRRKEGKLQASEPAHMLHGVQKPRQAETHDET